MANQRQGVPAGWTWRDGRPRWIPSPTLRKAGWSGWDLKDKRAAWLDRGASITLAQEIVDAVAGWRSGRLVDEKFKACAPASACANPGPGLPARADRLSIGALVAAWTGDPLAGIKPADEFARLAPGTQRDYRGKLKRLVDVLAGFAVLPAAGDKPAQLRYAAQVAAVKAASVFALEPTETRDGVQDLLHGAYWTLHGKVGQHQASGVLAVASAWLAWCRERQSRTIHNWAAEVSRETPPGRIRVGTWPEMQALVRAADKLALHGVGDAIVLALDLSWSQVDILSLTWDRLKDGRAMTGAAGRQKTGRVGGTPLTSLGKARVAAIRERQAALSVTPMKVVHLPRQRVHAARKADADSHYFRDLFALVRAEAVKDQPSLADFTFADLRDTAFSLGRDAGLSDDMTASRTLQSRKNIKALGDRHYGEIGPEIADQGRELLEAHIKAKGLSL